MKNKAMAMFFTLVGMLFVFDIWIAEAELKAYDANNQYIGVVTGSDGHNHYELSVFIPSLNVVAGINDVGDITSDGPLYFYYQSVDCSGAPYTSRVYPCIFKQTVCDTGKYFTVNINNSKTFLPISYNVYNSSTMQCECQQVPAYLAILKTYLPVVEFTKASLPFTLPVAIPLHFIYSSGDINGDGKVGLAEAINALQVVSGLKQ